MRSDAKLPRVIGNKIRKRRKELKVSQEWLAEKVNEVKSDLTPAQIISQFGFNEITKL